MTWIEKRLVKGNEVLQSPENAKAAIALVTLLPDPVMIFGMKYDLVFMNKTAEQLLLHEVGDNTASFVLSDPQLLDCLHGKVNSATYSANDSWYAVQRVDLQATGFEGYALLFKDITQSRRSMLNQNNYIRVVSHDLRSPLAAIHGFMGIFEAQFPHMTEQQEIIFNRISSGIDQMIDIVDNIQDAGRFDPETGFYEMVRTPCDLEEIILKIVANHLVPAEKSALTLTASIDENLPILYADHLMLTRAISNLVDNAIKYTPDGGKIMIHARQEDGNIRIEVEDTGYGISIEDQARLFQRHVRIARREHKSVKGVGLGLFIVHSIVVHHSGTVGVVSDLGKGSKFYIQLPVKSNTLFPNSSISS